MLPRFVPRSLGTENVRGGDEQPLGGVCVNWGCIPSKALLKTAELYQDISTSRRRWGFTPKIEGLDWTSVIQRSREVSEKNSSGVEFLVRKSKIHRPVGTDASGLSAITKLKYLSAKIRLK